MQRPHASRFGKLLVGNPHQQLVKSLLMRHAMAGILVRSKSIRLVAVSVGLRRSEIDGHFKAGLKSPCKRLWFQDSFPKPRVPSRGPSLTVCSHQRVKRNRTRCNS